MLCLKHHIYLLSNSHNDQGQEEIVDAYEEPNQEGEEGAQL
jgi:hypothetical protein